MTRAPIGTVGRADRRRGFTYLGVLYLLAIAGLTATMATVVWSRLAQKERERELLFVGQQFAQAIESYRQRGPADARRFPARLEDLLRDPRDSQVVRHLRRLWMDPFSGRPAWGLLRLQDGGIVGVFSRSQATPLQRTGFPPGLAFDAARRYSDWRFIAPSAAGASWLVDAGEGTPALPAAPEPGASAAEAPPATEGPAKQAVPRPPSQADFRNRTPEACARIAAYDRAICAEQAVLFGPRAGLDCADTAAQRAAVCPFVADGPLPPLFIRQR